ncbi:MAG: AraC family transcriptional regulator [Treponema sp.]|nr:AraC family transcriptional regulator [Treponema sp.]
MLVLVLPLLVSLMIYSTAITVVRGNAEKINTIALSQTGIALDQIFSDVYAAGRRILNQEAVTSLTYAERPLTSFKREKIGKLQAGLDEYAAQGNYFRKIYVYFRYGNFAASTEGLYGTEAFLKDLEREAGAGSPVLSWIQVGQQFQAYMAYSPPAPQARAPRADKLIVIMSDTPNGSVPDVVCFFVMDYKPVYALLDNYENKGGNESRYLWLFSPREGRVICSDSSFQLARDFDPDFSADSAYIKNLKARNMAVTVAQSQMSGWTLVSAIPFRQYAKELSRIHRVYLIYLGICLGAGLLISLVFAQKNYRPLRRLSAILDASSLERQGKPGYRSEFDYLADSIVLLLEKKQGYEKEIDRQRMLLSEGKLVKMMRGEIYSARAFEAACKEYSFNFPGKGFLIVGIAVNEYSGGIYQGEDEASAEDLVDMLHLAIGYVFEEMLRPFCAGYPCRYDDNIFIVASRRNAEDRDRETAEKDADGAAFTERLKGICREGEAVIRARFAVKVSVYISGVYAERQSGAMDIHDAFEETIWGLSQIKDFHEQETVKSKEDIQNAAAAEDDTVPLHAEIVRYINDQYANPNLSVTLIADHFCFSKSYLFRAFKKGENCGILDYIHQRRVEEAKILLRNSAAGINEIAAKIGYTNGLTLIRAFKRLEGITPTVYRHIAGRN